MFKTTVPALILILLGAVAGFSQIDEFERDRRERAEKAALELVTSVFSDVPENLRADFFKVPEENNSWKIYVVTRGGIMGKGKGNFVLTSAGNVFGNINKTLSKEDFKTLAEIVFANNLKFNDVSQNPVLDPFLAMSERVAECYDCYLINFVIIRRDNRGNASVFRTAWTEGFAPRKLVHALQLYEKVSSLAGNRRIID